MPGWSDINVEATTESESMDNNNIEHILAGSVEHKSVEAPEEKRNQHKKKVLIPPPTESPEEADVVASPRKAETLKANKKVKQSSASLVPSSSTSIQCPVFSFILLTLVYNL